MGEDDAPRTAYEIILERLKKRDREEGVEERPLTDEQKARIGELRKIYEAKVAEREILYHASLRKTYDPAEREALEEEYRRDRERMISERDRKVEEVRNSDA